MLADTFNRTFIIGLALSLLAVFILPYLLAAIIFILFLGIVYRSDRSFLISSIIIALLVFTRTEFQDLRNIVTGLSLVSLFFLFFKEYGFEFHIYPELPIEYKTLDIVLIFTVFLSTLANGMSAVSLFAFVRTLVFFTLCYILYGFGKGNIYLYINSLILAQLIIAISIIYDFINGG